MPQTTVHRLTVAILPGSRFRFTMMKRNLLWLTCAAIAAFPFGYAQDDRPQRNPVENPSPKIELPAAEDAAARETVTRMKAAFDRADAAGFASVFTEDGLFLWDGRVREGRAAILALQKRLFDEFLKGAKMAIEIKRVRRVAPDVVLVQGVGDVLNPGQETTDGSGHILTFLIVRRDNRWNIASFQNTKIQSYIQFYEGETGQ